MDVFLYWIQFSLLVFSSVTFFLVSYIPISQSYLLFINNVNYHASELIMQPGKSISILSSFNCWNSVKMSWNNFSWNNYWPFFLYTDASPLCVSRSTVSKLYILHSASCLPRYTWVSTMWTSWGQAFLKIPIFSTYDKHIIKKVKLNQYWLNRQKSWIHILCSFRYDILVPLYLCLEFWNQYFLPILLGAPKCTVICSTFYS